MKLVIMMALSGIFILCSCVKEKAAMTNQFSGEWQKIGDASGLKRIIFKGDGVAKFVELTAQDVGLNVAEQLSHDGTWKMDNEGKIMQFGFFLNDAEYDHSAKIVREKNGLEIWFSIGDPDDYAWVKYRRK